MKKAFLILFVLLFVILYALPVSISKSYIVFNDEQVPYMISVRNTDDNDIVLGKITLGGSHQNEFTITIDNCTQKTLSKGEVCDIGVKFTPKTKGIKNALLIIPFTDSTSDVVQNADVFLTNYQDTVINVRNNVSPMMYDVSLKDNLEAGKTYELNWSVLGFDDSYSCVVVVFDCSTSPAGECGDAYGSDNMILVTDDIGYKTKKLSSMEYDNQYENVFSFSYNLSISVKTSEGNDWKSDGTDIVVRLYIISSKDKADGKSTTSLIIPENIGGRHYDTSGRKLLRTVCPTGGCTQ
jgi:hypothetical protein